MNQVNFEVTPAEMDMIRAIVERALKVAAAEGFSVDPLDLSMDITAAHANGCRLRLSDLLAADDLNFSHDVFGIRKNIDRETGQFRNFFWPRFAKPEVEQ